MSILNTYKALADESRLRLVKILSHGFFNVQELTAILGLSQSTISHHLKTLQRAGVARTHKEGTWTYYSINKDSRDSASIDVVNHFLGTARTDSTNGLSELFALDHTAVSEVLNKRRDQAHQYFENVAGEWKELREEEFDQSGYISTLRDLLPDSGTLLEAGCGSGALLEQLLPRQGLTIGVDQSQAMLTEAQKGLEKFETDLELRLGAIEHLPVGDSTVDSAVVCMVMHHIPHPEEALRDIARVLKPEGKLVVVDLVRHNNEYMRERFADLWLGFDPKEMSAWATSVGLSEVSLQYPGESRETFVLTLRK